MLPHREWSWRLCEALADEDVDTMAGVLGGKLRKPDLTIAPNGEPYMHRWHVLPRDKLGVNVYLHLQVADDIAVMHDHPYDSTSVLIGGQGYHEVFQRAVRGAHIMGRREERTLFVGNMVHRLAKDAHTLRLLGDYSLSLFTTGPRIRDWGFWIDGAWRSQTEVLAEEYTGRGVAQHKDTRP